MTANTTSAVCQPNASINPTASGEIQKLPERAGRRAETESRRSPIRRHQLAERADDDGERASRRCRARSTRRPLSSTPSVVEYAISTRPSALQDGAGGQHAHASRIGRRSRRRTAARCPNSTFESRWRMRKRRGPSRWSATSASEKSQARSAARSRSPQSGNRKSASPMACASRRRPPFSQPRRLQCHPWDRLHAESIGAGPYRPRGPNQNESS